MEVTPIHSVPHLMEECCELLNMEWKRSDTARLRSLTASCDDLPTCLVLIQNENSTSKVIGHSKLSRIPTVPEGCFVESVVIHPNLRRRGLGKYLMIKTEDYAKSRGFTSIFLSTHDQEIFYGKLGYTVCPPVSIYGSSIQNKQTKGGTPKKEGAPVNVFHNCGESKKLSSNTPKSPPPPPPPPPMPMNEKCGELKKIFMNKQLAFRHRFSMEVDSKIHDKWSTALKVEISDVWKVLWSHLHFLLLRDISLYASNNGKY